MSNLDDLFDPTPQKEDFDKEAWAAKKKAERDEVYALADEMATEAVSNGEIFRIYLGMQAQFSHYSATNVLLILAQNGDATKLRDYEGWANCGYFVKKNESGISILEPGKTNTPVMTAVSAFRTTLKECTIFRRPLPVCGHSRPSPTTKGLC